MANLSYAELFNPVIDLIHSPSFLSGIPDAAMDKGVLFIDDAEKAIETSRTQWDDAYSVWLDIRESVAGNAKAPSDRLEIRVAWEENVLPEILKRIPAFLSDASNDIEADLYFCSQNIYFNRNSLFHNKLWSLYKKGFWPCGWEGDYPDGRMVAYCSKIT
ncbi:MAG: hypothetical protein FWC42_05985 [Proteobacteria bacterium]|nr:hypothetical protein [Pseudomonadota bacterium]